MPAFAVSTGVHPPSTLLVSPELRAMFGRVTGPKGLHGRAAKILGAAVPVNYVQLLSLQPGWLRSRRAPRFLLLPVARRAWHQSKQPGLQLQAALQAQGLAAASQAGNSQDPQDVGKHAPDAAE